MGTRPSVILGASIVLAAMVIMFGPRLLNPATVGASLDASEVEYEDGSVQYLTEAGNSTTSNTMKGRFRVRHSGDFLIIKHWGDTGTEYGLYLPKERVIYVGGIQKRK